MNIATKWQIRSQDGIGGFWEIVKIDYMRDTYIGTFMNFEYEILDVRRGTKAEWLEYLSKCKEAVELSALYKYLLKYTREKRMEEINKAFAGDLREALKPEKLQLLQSEGDCMKIDSNSNRMVEK